MDTQIVSFTLWTKGIWLSSCAATLSFSKKNRYPEFSLKKICVFTTNTFGNCPKVSLKMSSDVLLINVETVFQSPAPDIKVTSWTWSELWYDTLWYYYGVTAPSLLARMCHRGSWLAGLPGDSSLAEKGISNQRGGHQALVSLSLSLSPCSLHATRPAELSVSREAGWGIMSLICAHLMAAVVQFCFVRLGWRINPLVGRSGTRLWDLFILAGPLVCLFCFMIGKWIKLNFL